MFRIDADKNLSFNNFTHAFIFRPPLLLSCTHFAVIPFFASASNHSTKLTATVAVEKCTNTKQNDEERE
jgi:hypothetical protein